MFDYECDKKCRRRSTDVTNSWGASCCLSSPLTKKA